MILNHLHCFWRAYVLNGLLLVLLLCGHTLAHGQADNDGEITSGELRLTGDNTQKQALLKNTAFDITVNGMLARVVVIQEFANTSDEWVEGEYVFPLPNDSAVDYMAMTIGERKIIGQIREKQQAKKIYQKAKKAGKKAALLVQRRPNLFTNRVANIGPRETVRVELHYVQTLHYDQGRFSLRAPTTLTPRYIPGRAFPHASQPKTLAQPKMLDGSGWALPTDQVPDAPHITPPMKPSDQAAPLTLAAEVNLGVPLGSVESLHHPAAITKEQGSFQLSLKPGAKLDRDVVLEWEPVKGQAPLAAAFQETLGDEHYLLLMIMPPQNFKTTTRVPRETVFVIDTSGSMSGNSIRQARDALINGLDRLGPQDRFNIVAFNNRAHRLWPRAVPASTVNLTRASRYVGGLDAGGGTNITHALDSAFENQADGGAVRQVMFITDGSVGNEDALFTQIEKQRGKSRLFTVGIGSAPNGHFMERAAQAGRGSFTYIGARDQIQQKMSDLFYKLENPVMHNIQLSFGQADMEVFPRRLPDLYAGEPVIVAARTDDSLPGYVSVTGQQADKHYEQQLSLTQNRRATSISKVWARQKLKSLYERERRVYRSADKSQPLKAAITQLALDHQLMSKYTSFVAVEKTPSRPTDKALRKHTEANAMPAGNTMRIPVPQGALGLKSLWQWALLCLAAWLLLNTPRVRRWCSA